MIITSNTLYQLCVFIESDTTLCYNKLEVRNLEKHCNIYKIENLVNGIVYIGQTRTGFKSRLNAHLRLLRKGEHQNEYLQRAWNKYGESNFEYSLIEVCSLTELDDLEIKWIEHYRNLSGVYNLDGGGLKNKTISPSTRLKMSKSVRERFRNPEYYKKISLINSSYRGSGSPNAKSVVCVNTKEEFGSISEASEKYGIPRGNIGKCCLRERQFAGVMDNGDYMVWRFKEDYDPNEKCNFKRDTDWLCKKVVCVNTKEIFDSIKEASEKTGINQSHISSCCKGKRNFAGRMDDGDYIVWEYQENYSPSKKYDFSRNTGRKNHRSRRVACLTTGEVFETMSEAGKRYGIKHYCTISSVCSGKKKTAGKLPDGTKLEWAYLDDPPKAPE